MLTADLLDFHRHKGGVTPRLLDPAARGALAAAEALIGLVQAHVGRPRGELDEALRAVDFPALSARAAQGLARLLAERCTFEVAAAADPAALRSAVFDAAAAAWRAGEAPQPPWRERALARGAAAVGVDAGAVEAALFADLEENQRLLTFDAPTPAALLHRYNVAQVQGLLLRAERVQLTAPWPPPRRLRQLMRYLKFYGLLYRQEPAPPRRRGEAPLVLAVDGPLSVLESATRYGLNLAQFFPALLLWEEPWRLEAALRLGKGRTRAALALEPHPWLRSHYPDHGQWVSEAVRRFVSAFNEGDAAWRAAPAEALVTLPGNRCLVPDFELRPATGGPPVYLEHLPYPDAHLVAARLEQIAAAGRTDYLLACRGVPAVKALPHPPPWLVTYRRTLLPSGVRAALARLPGRA